MKNLFSFFLFGALLSAAPVTDQVTLKTAGSPIVADPSGNDVGPYTVSLNGGSDVYALCVDNKDISSLNTTWTANVTNLASSSLSNTYDPNGGTEYKESAYLFNQIIQANSDRVDIQHAVWDIIDYNIGSAATLQSLIGSGTLSQSDGAITYITSALNGYTSINASLFDILTATNGPREQEFLVADPVSAAPEPTTYALLAAGLLLVGGSRILHRRKIAKRTKAAPAGLVRAS